MTTWLVIAVMITVGGGTEGDCEEKCDHQYANYSGIKFNHQYAS